ncbi:Hypothetical predicted protein [Paramuricea clavata]|uniref:Uncharacterized protein n=1 Tax=Paramuricea clavata TaxID=317549 RepID=A0A6S7GLB1_PARCT|nr:Hypothetical predicted protein [Paramuricea clavata]
MSAERAQRSTDQKKLIKQFRKKENDERRASGISPELTELDTLLEEISEKEEASETLAADMGEREKRRLEDDQMAGQEMQKRAMGTLSETQKRNTKIDQDSPNAKSERVIIQPWHFWQKRQKKKQN